jgi:single-stranded-DNA-specific exonuclease
MTTAETIRSFRWTVRTDRPPAVDLLIGAGHDPLMALLLARRGASTPAAAEAFLHPKLTNLHPPDTLPDMDRARARILDAVRRGERVIIFGDYDADGLCSSAMLRYVLGRLGLTAEIIIPNRLEDGYGLSRAGVAAVLAKKPGLVIAVDCGVTSVDAARALREQGVDLVIVDHHEPGPELPEAVAIVDPKRADSASLFDGLCAAGLVYKLCWALLETVSGQKRLRGDLREVLLDLTALAGIATVADVVPLVDENRALVAHGLGKLAASTRPGLAALRGLCALRGRAVNERDVAFKIGPRLNAAGRLGEHEVALELLTTESEARAHLLADKLDALNNQRRAVDADLLKHARAMAEAGGYADRAAIVMGDESWHPGVIGIVASRLVEAFGKPVILIAFQDGLGRGSGRSVPGLHLQEALMACAEHIIHGGGHAAAIGLTIDRGRLDAFRAAFEAEVARRMADRPPGRVIEAEAEITLDKVTPELVESLARMSPFGEGNPEPKFLARGVSVVGKPAPLGSAGSHLQARLRHGAGPALRAVAWNRGARVAELAAHPSWDIIFKPGINEFRGERNVELYLTDIRPAEPV